jgi:hypothetical protein
MGYEEDKDVVIGYRVEIAGCVIDRKLTDDYSFEEIYHQWCEERGEWPACTVFSYGDFWGNGADGFVIGMSVTSPSVVPDGNGGYDRVDGKFCHRADPSAIGFMAKGQAKAFAEYATGSDSAIFGAWLVTCVS